MHDSLSHPISPPFPQATAELFKQVFGNMLPTVRRQQVLRVLKIWHFCSRLVESDVTLGMATFVSERFGVSYIDVEDPIELATDPPPHVR